MESGVTVLAPAGATPVGLARGMAVFAAGGELAGWIAGVLIDDDTQLASHLLVRMTTLAAPYHLAPVTLITVVNEEMIHLVLASREIGELPVHHPA